LKPENVLMVPDPETSSGERAKVLDFGIAKLVDPGEGEVLKTTTGAILGTPTYMSPEQCRGVGKVTDKADVYSLGCMLYQMLAGRVPFVGHGAGDLIAMHIMEAPEPLRSLAPDIAPEVEVLVHQLLEKKPEQRPSMRQVLNSLEQLGHGSTSSGHGSVIIVQAPAGAGRTSEIKRRSPLPIVLGAVGLVLIGGIAIVASHRPQVVTPPVKPVVSDPPPRPADAKVAAAPGAVTLSVTSDPVGAQVLSSPELKPLGGTPWRTERLPSQGKLEVVIRLPGYFDQKLVFDGIHDDARAIKLAVTPAAAPDPGKRPGPVVKKPWQKPAGKPAGPASTKKKGDEDVDVPVVR
jgi:serine/threonine protein kinase